MSSSERTWQDTIIYAKAIQEGRGEREGREGREERDGRQGREK